MLLKEFEIIFRKDILPIYQNHQKTFDEYGMHGCLHISRSLIICRALYKKLSDKGFNLDIDAITYAVAFHDSGRKANGVDYWENESRINCYNYLASHSIPNPDFISNMISKNVNANDYNHLCVYDTDVIEIGRPCSGVGVYNFNHSYLKCNHIFGESYNQFISESFGFILETEASKELYSDENTLINLINFLETQKGKYPTLYNASIS